VLGIVDRREQVDLDLSWFEQNGQVDERCDGREFRMTEAL